MDKVYVLKLFQLIEDEDRTIAISQMGGIYASVELADEDGPVLCDKRGYDDWSVEEWDLIDGQNGNHNSLLDINTNQNCRWPQ